MPTDFEHVWQHLVRSGQYPANVVNFEPQLRDIALTLAVLPDFGQRWQRFGQNWHPFGQVWPSSAELSRNRNLAKFAQGLSPNSRKDCPKLCQVKPKHRRARARIGQIRANSGLDRSWHGNSHLSGTALALGWYGSGAVLVLLHWNCTGTAPALHWDCAGTTRVLHWGFTGTALVLRWYCTGNLHVYGTGTSTLLFLLGNHQH